MASKSTPQLIFGAASFGDSFSEAQDVQSVLELLKSPEINITRIDTAGRYPPTNPGRSEELLGEVGAARQGFMIDSKILAINADGSGELKRDKIEESVANSLRRLGISKLNVLHIHRFDPRTPLEEQAAGLDAIHKRGKFIALGVSNFLPENLRAFLAVCDRYDYVKPTVYQGDYSMINRGIEKQLLPLLREHGIVFNAFRTLGSGFLSGSVTSGSKEGTRFGGDSRTSQYMNKIYDNIPLHNAQRRLAESSSHLGISTIEAAIRWAVYHSALREQDGIILGASKEEQVANNLRSIANGPLPANMVATIEEIWDNLKGEKEDNYIY